MSGIQAAIAVLLVLSILVGGAVVGYRREQKELKASGMPDTYTHVIVIDGCEYLTSNEGVSRSYCHKGNCKNPIHSKP